MRRLRNLSFVVLLLLSAASLRAIDYVAGYPQCHYPENTNGVAVLAYGTMDCEDPDQRWNDCLQACRDCYGTGKIANFGVHYCEDFGDGTYGLECTCTLNPE